MKTMKRLLTIAALALAAASCNNDTADIVSATNTIRVEASLPAASRATQTAFESGDVMGLFAVEYIDGVAQPLQLIGNYINNQPLTYNGTEWQAERTLYWSESACDFYGVYPYQELKTIKDFTFDIQTDQSTERTEESLGGYEASDLMWAVQNNVTRDMGSVQLPFKHLMSRLVVKLVKGPKFEGELPEQISAHVYNTAITALVNISKGNLEKYSESPKRTITMRQIADDTFDAIIVPQNIERNTPLIEITMDGIAYLLEYSLSFRPGYQHTVELTLNTSPDQEKIEISIDGDVDEW